MSKNKTVNEATIAALAFLVIVLVFASVGWCGKPGDHQPKPQPSVSTSIKSPTVRKS